MPELQQRLDPSKSRLVPVTALFAAIALIVSVWSAFHVPAKERLLSSNSITDDSLMSIVSRGSIRVGYGGFPPYTLDDVKDSNAAGRIKGFSVDIIREIASRASPPLKVEFFPFSWDSLRPEVLSGKFDLIIDPVFQTVPRAVDFRLIRPYSYFGIAVGLVRKDENRFKTFSDLDRADITIALAEGWTSSEYARQNLSKPKFNSVPVTGDGFSQLDEVRLGRADVALNDVPTIAQYVAAHSDTVKALWIDAPPSFVPGGFLVRKDSKELAEFLDTTMTILIADGTLTRLDQKWKTYGSIPQIAGKPGEGLRAVMQAR